MRKDSFEFYVQWAIVILMVVIACYLMLKV